MHPIPLSKSIKDTSDFIVLKRIVTEKQLEIISNAKRTSFRKIAFVIKCLKHNKVSAVGNIAHDHIKKEKEKGKSLNL